MKIVSVILARGGSKGIPKKNIIDLHGMPLIHYTINASQNSKVHETWVSTDDDDIARIAKDANALVLKRPSDLATDVSQSEDALIHFANNVDFDILVFIQPTSPLLDHMYINNGLDMMPDYDSVFSAYKEHWLPRWQRNVMPYMWSTRQRPRRQDREELYVENGAFYITTKQQLMQSGLRYGGRTGIVEMPLQKSFQIDTYEDLELIQRLL